MDLRIPKIYFWPAKTRKNPKLLGMHTCLWPGAQMCFRQKWRKLTTPSLLLLCIDGYSCLRYWTEIFSSLFQVSDWSFFVVHFDVNTCNSIPKLIWRRLVIFWSISSDYASYRWLHIWMDSNLNELFIQFSFLTASSFLDVWFEMYSGLFYKNNSTFSP